MHRCFSRSIPSNQVDSNCGARLLRNLLTSLTSPPHFLTRSACSSTAPWIANMPTSGFLTAENSAIYSVKMLRDTLRLVPEEICGKMVLLMTSTTSITSDLIRMIWSDIRWSHHPSAGGNRISKLLVPGTRRRQRKCRVSASASTSS